MRKCKFQDKAYKEIDEKGLKLRTIINKTIKYGACLEVAYHSLIDGENASVLVSMLAELMVLEDYEYSKTKYKDAAGFCDYYGERYFTVYNELLDLREAGELEDNDFERVGLIDTISVDPIKNKNYLRDLEMLLSVNQAVHENEYPSLVAVGLCEGEYQLYGEVYRKCGWTIHKLEELKNDCEIEYIAYYK